MGAVDAWLLLTREEQAYGFRGESWLCGDEGIEDEVVDERW